MFRCMEEQDAQDTFGSTPALILCSLSFDVPLPRVRARADRSDAVAVELLGQSAGFQPPRSSSTFFKVRKPSTVQGAPP